MRPPASRIRCETARSICGERWRPGILGTNGAACRRVHFERVIVSRQSGEQPELGTDAAVGANASASGIGPPVVQQTTLEPNFERFDLFFIWPLVEPVDETELRYDPLRERLTRRQHFHYQAPLGEFRFEVLTSGLADGRQVPLVPCCGKVRPTPLLQMPGGDWSLPRLTALASRWRTEAGVAADQHEKIARLFERRLSSSDQFHYSLQPVQSRRIDRRH